MPRTGLRLDSPAPRRIPTPASVREGRGEDAVRVASNPLTQEANQPVRATPGCALLIFLAQVPGAPEPLFGRVAQAGRADFPVNACQAKDRAVPAAGFLHFPVFAWAQVFKIV